MLIMIYYENDESVIYDNKSDFIIYWVRVIIIILTIIVDICLIARYYVRLNLMKLSQEVKASENLCSTVLIFKLMAELAL
jgi:hypothetical protein